jgi:transcriptional regulator GlxA family with amidase domain
MQAKDFFHLASLRYGKQLGHGLTPAFETRLVSPDGQPVRSFSDVKMPVDGGLEDADIIVFRPSGTISTPCANVIHRSCRGCASNMRVARCSAAKPPACSGWPRPAARRQGSDHLLALLQCLRRALPKVQLNQDKHLTDADNLYCAGGTTSACDLYIYLIERFCGANIAQAVARDILYEVQRSYSPGRIGFGGQKLHQDVIILQIQHWLEEHFADKFRFEDVAREHGMSIRNFMRRFQTATGDKPLHYLQRLRIETAKGLLSGSRKSIKTISYEVGYDDASFFARLFRQHTELSPNQYRQQFQQAA